MPSDHADANHGRGELVVGGERPRGFGVGQRGGTRECAGLGLENLEVVVEHQHLGVAACGTLMTRYQPVGVENFHRGGGQSHGQAPPGIPGGHRVVALAHRNPCPQIHPRA